MRCSRALVVLLAVATVAAFAGAAAAADPEPPGAVLVSPDAGSYSALSVSPGRVVWEGSGTVQKRAVTSDASTVTLGAQTTIGHGLLSPYQYPTGLSSGARTLWASSNGHPYGYQVNLTSGTSTKVLSHAAVPVRLSGNRALYQRQTDAHYVLYDMHTGKSTDVTEKYNTRTSSYSFTVDLFGNYLVYTTKSFAIMRKNLSDGSAPLTIVPPDHNGNNGSVVIIYGDWVAWDRYFHPGDGFDAFDHCGLKNLRTMAPATHNCVTDLTSAGSIKRTWINSSTFAWSLRPYGTTTDTALPVPSSTHDLGIDGNVMAWTDTSGVDAAPFADAPSNPPRSLGDPITSKTYTLGGTSWPFRLVTTAELTSCHVQISQSGVVVRQLDCEPTVMGSGEVLVRWDGRDGDGKQVAPGTYRWTAYASNADGSMLRSDGVAKQTSGVVTVTH